MTNYISASINQFAKHAGLDPSSIFLRRDRAHEQKSTIYYYVMRTGQGQIGVATRTHLRRGKTQIKYTTNDGRTFTYEYDTGQIAAEVEL